MPPLPPPPALGEGSVLPLQLLEVSGVETGAGQVPEHLSAIRATQSQGTHAGCNLLQVWRRVLRGPGRGQHWGSPKYPPTTSLLVLQSLPPPRISPP